jgi:hypothetical protein
MESLKLMAAAGPSAHTLPGSQVLQLAEVLEYWDILDRAGLRLAQEQCEPRALPVRNVADARRAHERQRASLQQM